MDLVLISIHVIISSDLVKNSESNIDLLITKNIARVLLYASVNDVHIPN